MQTDEQALVERMARAMCKVDGEDCKNCKPACSFWVQFAAAAHTIAKEHYGAMVEDLRAELARRDRNENRNCLNWGPCSRHDGPMDDAAFASTKEGTQP